MKIIDLHKWEFSEGLIKSDETTRITVSENDLVNSKVFYEDLTKHDAKLTIGKFCSISTRVSFFLGGNHNIKRISTWLPELDMKYDGTRDLLTNGDIIIENDVWIGMNVMIMSGVKIGSGSVIGAGAVVSKNVEPYSIVVGNPARVIRKRFTDDQIDILLKSEWWDWDFSIIQENSEIIFGESFEKFEELTKIYEIDK
jgi:chloramphenicol O-acetyltransferase type B